MGARSGVVTIVDSASTSPQNVPLSGTGIVNLTLSPTKLNFSNQAVGTVSELQTVQPHNSSTVTIPITSVVITGDFTVLDSCFARVPAGYYCDLDIKFVPTAIGPRTGTLTILDGATNSPQPVALSGNGIAPQMT